MPAATGIVPALRAEWLLGPDATARGVPEREAGAAEEDRGDA